MDKKKFYILVTLTGIILISYLKRKPIIKKAKNVMTNLKRKQFIESLTPAVKQLAVKIGVPYKFMLAQISLETGYGTSQLFSKHFNVGGEKAVKNQPFVSYLTTECNKNGVCTKIYQNFAKYNNLAEGLTAYGKILTNRYFKKYANKTQDAKEYAVLLQSGAPKYATDPNYVKKIHSIIDTI
jgi:flagellum-specific peptidoglycan hydrolase FlgJ